MGILQVFDPFFENVDKDSRPAPGDLYWVPIPDTDEVARILDVKRASPDEHFATEFSVMEINDDHFRSRERLPIKKLNLGDTEELLITKAKKRPSVVLARGRVEDIASIQDGAQRRVAQSLGRLCYFVAPMYSVSTMLKETMFGPVLVARVRALQYLHLFCLPDFNEPGTPSSIIRLDRLLSTYLGRGCTRMGTRLHPEPFEVLQSQFSILTGGVNSEPYELVRGLAQDALPDDLKMGN